jgi:hypothetical protein
VAISTRYQHSHRISWHKTAAISIESNLASTFLSAHKVPSRRSRNGHTCDLGVTLRSVQVLARQFSTGEKERMNEPRNALKALRVLICVEGGEI